MAGGRWLAAAAALVVVPLLWLGIGIWWGTGRSKSAFELPPPAPLPSPPQVAVAPPTLATAKPESALSTAWDDPTRLAAAVDFLLKQGDRPGALALVARMKPGDSATERALTLVNREYLRAWHPAAAAAVRTCLAQDASLTPSVRQDLVTFLAGCSPDEAKVQPLPASSGGIRALLLAAQIREGFAATAADCPASYVQTLASRLLAEFPGAPALLGTVASPLAWGDLKKSAVVHLRGSLLLPLLGQRLGELRAHAAETPAVATWLAGIATDPAGWRGYLASGDSAADRRQALAVLPPLVRQSWQRDAALQILDRPGVREFLVAGDLFDSIWPGEANDGERLELGRIVIASAAWQTAMRSLDYPVAEAAAGAGVEVLLGDTRHDVTDLLRAAIAREKGLLSARGFPWFRVMQSMQVRDVPAFWLGKDSMEPGDLALLLGGRNRIGAVAPATVYECMVRHASRIAEPVAQQAALEGARVYAQNRGLVAASPR